MIMIMIIMIMMMIIMMTTLTVRPWSRPPESVKPQGTAEECRVSVRSETGNKWKYEMFPLSHVCRFDHFICFT